MNLMSVVSGRTLDVAAGIKIEGENELATLIQNGALACRVAQAQNPERPESSVADL